MCVILFIFVMVVILLLFIFCSHIYNMVFQFYIDSTNSHNNFNRQNNIMIIIHYVSNTQNNNEENINSFSLTEIFEEKNYNIAIKQ